MGPVRDERWYSVEGRITRMTWLLRVLGTSVALLVLMFGTLVAMPPDAEGAREVFILGFTLGFVGFLVFRIIQDVKRLHDLGHSGLWALCAFVPAVNLIYLVVIIFADGQPCTNEYGPDPKGRGSDIEAIASVFR